jgi:hypothetical protein
MSAITQAMRTINFDEENKVGGEYGLHDGFFNALVFIDGDHYHVQGCADNNIFKPEDCGHDDGICGEVNERLASKIAQEFDGDIVNGFSGVQDILREAFRIYRTRWTTC